MALLGATVSELLFVGFLVGLTLLGTYVGDVSEAIAARLRGRP